MNIPDIPAIEGFTPIQAFQTLDVGYVMMRSPAGVRLDLSETGGGAADEDPRLLALFERMGDFIAEHDGYKDVDKVREAEPGRIYGVSNPSRGSDGYKLVLASVYHPDSAPGAVVKAYDLNPRSAGMQFYLGAWLEGKLAGADSGLRSPRQLAMFTAPSGHRTTVMEYIPGKTLGKVRSEMNLGNPERRDTDRMVHAVRTSIRQTINRAAGWRGRVIANDIKNIENIIVEGEEALSPGNVTAQNLAIIDQPVVTVFNFPLEALARSLPAIGTRTTESAASAPTSLR